MIASLREENASLRENQATVFSTMLEAQKYAEQLRTDSERQRQQTQERLAAAVQQKSGQLDRYQEQIHQLRVIIRELLEDFNGRLEETEHVLVRLTDQVPGVELDTVPSGPDEGGSELWKRISFT